MTKSEFARKVSEYWTRTPETVVDEIAQVVSRAPEAALRAIYEYMRKHLEPNKMVGVSHVHEAAANTGSALSRRESAEFDLKCSACGAVWSYKQGLRDRCPHCEMEGIWILNKRSYEKPIEDGRQRSAPDVFNLAYERLRRRCMERVR
jgi:predicted Zn-ribbon and HTH transcriptional regulator